jgi:hypothetical protein
MTTFMARLINKLTENSCRMAHNLTAKQDMLKDEIYIGSAHSQETANRLHE